MTRWITQFTLSLGLVALIAAPEMVQAGAMLKEHECVGKDTALDLQDEDAGCTPLGSEIFPPGGPGNEYEDGDVDESGAEFFNARGALEVRPPGSNVWQTIPTIKEPGFQQVGFPATLDWNMVIKSSSVLSKNVEVICSVCAHRPQSLGPGQTYARFEDNNGSSPLGEGEIEGEGDFIQRLNIAQEPWRMRVSHLCGPANPIGVGCGGPLAARTLTGLFPTFESEVTFIGCKQTVLLVENRGQFFRGDILDVTIDVPAAARVSGTFDVTSCEASYIRACLPGEGQFKDICRGEP